MSGSERLLGRQVLHLLDEPALTVMQAPRERAERHDSSDAYLFHPKIGRCNRVARTPDRPAGAMLAEGLSVDVSMSSMTRQSKRKSTNFDDT